MLEHARALGDETILGARLVDLDLSLLFMLGLFLVFAFLLTKLITRPMMQSQEQRFVSMEGARAAASNAELVAAETQLAYEKQLTSARQTAVEVREQLREEALKASRETHEAVKHEVAAQVTASQTELEAAASKVRGEMKPHVEELAATLSAKIIKHAGGKA